VQPEGLGKLGGGGGNALASLGLSSMYTPSFGHSGHRQ
jgi:hypothetical protein